MSAKNPVLGSFATPCHDAVAPGARARRALSLMQRAGLRYLPVRRAKKVVGLVKDSSLRAALAGGGNRRVSDLMIPNPSVFSPETSLYEALDALPESAGGCEVVQTKAGDITGIFTSDDALKAFHSLLVARPAARRPRSERGSRRTSPARS